MREAMAVSCEAQPRMNVGLRLASPLRWPKLGSRFLLQPDVVSQQTKSFSASLLCTSKGFCPFLTEALRACCG